MGAREWEIAATSSHTPTGSQPRPPRAGRAAERAREAFRTPESSSGDHQTLSFARPGSETKYPSPLAESGPLSCSGRVAFRCGLSLSAAMTALGQEIASRSQLRHSDVKIRRKTRKRLHGHSNTCSIRLSNTLQNRLKPNSSTRTKARGNQRERKTRGRRPFGEETQHERPVSFTP